MTTTKRAFILKLVRMQLATEAAVERAAMAYNIDRAYDAGEFSGPAINRGLEREKAAIRERFGIGSQEVAISLVSLFKCELVSGCWWL